MASVWSLPVQRFNLPKLYAVVYSSNGVTWHFAKQTAYVAEQGQPVLFSDPLEAIRFADKAQDSYPSTMMGSIVQFKVVSLSELDLNWSNA